MDFGASLKICNADVKQNFATLALQNTRDFWDLGTALALYSKQTLTKTTWKTGSLRVVGWASWFFLQNKSLKKL